MKKKKDHDCTISMNTLSELFHNMGNNNKSWERKKNITNANEKLIFKEQNKNDITKNAMIMECKLRQVNK